MNDKLDKLKLTLDHIIEEAFNYGVQYQLCEKGYKEDWNINRCFENVSYDYDFIIEIFEQKENMGHKE